MSITKLRGSTQIKDYSIDLSKLEQDFLKGQDWNVTGGNNNATITGLKAGVNANDAVNKAQLDALAASLSAGLDYKGLLDASNASFASQANSKGDFYKVSVAGVVDGIELAVGDMVIINKDSAIGAFVGADIDKIDNTEAADILRLAHIVDSLSSDDAQKVLSAKQGKALKALIDSEAADRASAVSAEASARSAADANLQSNIDAEASARSAADAVNAAAVVTEHDARVAADAALQTNIDSEASARAAADSALTTALNAEIANRQSADATVQANIAAEAVSRANADTALQAAVDAEATARSNAFDAVSTSIAAEVSARQAADVTINENITSEISARQTADTTLQTNINTEAASRAAADTALQANIDSEAAARLAADNANAAAIAAEVSRAQAAEAAISASIAAQPIEVVEEAPAVTGGASALAALIHAPIATSLKVYLNGLRQRQGASNDYTVSGSVINFTFNLDAADVVVVDYKYQP